MFRLPIGLRMVVHPIHRRSLFDGTGVAGDAQKIIIKQSNFLSRISERPGNPSRGVK